MVATAYQVDASIEEERERSAWPLLFFPPEFWATWRVKLNVWHDDDSVNSLAPVVGEALAPCKPIPHIAPGRCCVVRG